MGFNKRYINEEKVKQVLKEDGLQYLIDYIKSPDALIIEDELSEKVVNIIKEDEKKAFMGLAKLGLYGS